MRYRREVDGLRALAVLPVILFHAGFRAFGGGFVGVDVFFVISGYLITTILISELEQGKFSIVDFYERRARRILPALFFVMLTCLPFAWFFLLPEDIHRFAQSLVAVSLFASNLLFYRTSGYFDTLAELKPLLHTWSLAVEEQYYLFFPVLLSVIWRFGKRRVLGFLVALFVASLFAAQWFSVIKPMASFFLLPARGWELLIGAFVAFYFSGDFDRKYRKLDEVFSFMGLALVVYSVFAFDSHTPSASLYTLVPTLGTALILLFSTETTAVGRFLGARSLVGIGLVSYSAYLWHQPLLAFAKCLSTYDLSASLAGFLVLLTFILSYFSWKYIESPFRNRAKFDRSNLFRFSALGSLFFLVIGWVGTNTQVFESSHTYVKSYEGDVGHLEFHKYVAEKFFRCTPEPIAREALVWEGYLRCMQSRKNSEVDVAVIGDSHAEHLFIGLAESLSTKNLAFYIKGSSPFVKNPEFSTIFDHVLKSQSIKVVILAMLWGGRRQSLPKNTTLEKELRQTLQTLVASGKTVYLLDDVPKFPFPPERCKFYVPGLSSPVCHMDRIELQRNERAYLAILKKVAREVPGVTFAGIGNSLCNEWVCSMVHHGSLMYRDENHLNILGSKFVGSEIVRQFPKLNE